LDTQEHSSCKHTAFIAISTRRLSLEEQNPSVVEPATADPDPSDSSSETDIFQRETPNPLQCLSQAVLQILSLKSSETNIQGDIPPQNPTQTIPQHSKSTPSDKPAHPARLPMLAQSPTNATFFDNDEEYEDQQDDEIPQTPLQSPAALTSSTRTDFTYPPIIDLTKTLLKYAKNANLCKLSYPTDLVARQRQSDAFMDNLQIVCNISPWTRQVFELWPRQISYSHPFICSALYNLIFTHICDPCQKHNIDGPPDARRAIFTLNAHVKPSFPSNKDTMKLQPLTLTKFESLPKNAILLEIPTPMLTLSNALSAVEAITITMQPHINDLMPTFAGPTQ
jgi:hypothetical protein